VTQPPAEVVAPSYVRRFGEPGSGRPRTLSRVVGVLLVIYVVKFCSVHSEVKGGEMSHGVYDLLWLCNLSVVLAAGGMLIQSHLLIGTSIACVAFSHLSWTFDMFYWLVFDTFQIGRAYYLDDKDFDDLWWTTLHQLWFIPLCFLILYVDYYPLGIKAKCWVYSVAINTVITMLAFFRFQSLSDGTQMEPISDFGTGHEFWKPSQKDIVHQFDNAVWPIFLTWRLLVESVLLNGSCFVFLKLLSVLVLEDLSEKLREK